MDFSDILDALDLNDFEETPVDVETFCYSPEYLGLPPLSDRQLEIVRAGTQIYREDTLINLYGIEQGEREWESTFNEVVLQLGKGCHSANDMIYDPSTGTWKAIGSLVSSPTGRVRGENGPEDRTESFSKGMAEVFDVSTHRGLKCRVTGEHKFITRRGPVELLKLRKTDMIKTAARIEVENPVPVDPDEMFVVAVLLGNMIAWDRQQYGWEISGRRVSPTTYLGHRYLDTVIAHGDAPEIILSGLAISWVQNEIDSPWTMSIARKHGIHAASPYEKRVPDAFLSMPTDQVVGFLSLIYEIAGQFNSYRIDENITQAQARLEITSKYMAQDIVLLLARLGVVGRVTQYDRKRKNQYQSPTYQVMVTHFEGIRRLYESIHMGVKQDKFASVVDAMRHSDAWSQYDGDVFWDKVTLVESAGVEEVFSLTAVDTHVYNSNMIYHVNSGKDFVSTVICAYIVYKLLCLRDPARYFGKPPGDSIDIINVAINAVQARNVFFNNFKKRLDNSPWFLGRYKDKMDMVEFDKNVNVFSGHSEREAFEGYNCRKLNTLILTKSGWKTYDQLQIGEDVYTLNHDTSAGEWKPVQDIHVYDVVDEQMVEFSSNSLMATSTLDHRWATVTESGERRWKTTATIDDDDLIPLQAVSADLPAEKTYSDDMVEIIAWYMTEGFSDSRHNEIYQSYTANPDKVERIRGCLTREFGPPSGAKFHKDRQVHSWREHRNRKLAEFKINKSLWRDRIEPLAPNLVPTYDFMNSLTHDQLQLFVNICMAADNRGPECLAQKNYAMAEIFAYACVLLGIPVSVKEVSVPGYDYKMLCVRMRKKLTDSIRSTSSALYTGKVWCPTVENGTWLSREEGSVHFTGNCIAVVLDEISGFPIASNTAHGSDKTAGAIYDMYRASVDSRFPGIGKVILLSFPRFKGDYIQQHYARAIKEKETVRRTHEFIVDDSKPADQDNKFVIEWEEDVIKEYAYPRVFAMKCPTWEVNPLIKLEDLKPRFMANPVDTLARFACMPPEATDVYFPSREKIERAFRNMNLAVDEDGRFAGWFKPIDDKEYFMHVDLAQKHDRAAVAMAHLSSWTNVTSMGRTYARAPVIEVDLVRYWTPTLDRKIDFPDIKNFILEVIRRGFNVKMVTFDRWNSETLMDELRGFGLKSETLSVAKKHYDDMKMAVSEERIVGPSISILIDELAKLRIVGDKIDHPYKSGKDLADAACGAIFNAATLTNLNADDLQEIEIILNAPAEDDIPKVRPEIDPPKREMPEDLRFALTML